MKAVLVPRKFRSVREKGSAHRRNKSSDPGARPRISQDVNGLWNAIFKSDATKQAQKEKEESEKEATKIGDIAKRLDELDYHNIAGEHIRIALQSKYAAGNVDKAVELLQLQQQAFAGILQPYNPNIQMLGAQNRGAVTCYLDALLFAMFAKLTAFECMLKNDSTDQADRNLAAWLRLWVNMLRSGKLIHTDMTQRIQEALAECGWADAKELEQQDTSEAFGFITEKLQLPLLALQVDLFHQGKGDADDHKVVHERLLNLAVPPDPEGKGIKLEDCLEEYFNNKVDVHRDSLEEKRGSEKALSTPRSTIRVVTPEEGAGPSHARDESPLQRRWTTATGTVASPTSKAGAMFQHEAEARSSPRHRATSIIQRFVLDKEGHATDADAEDASSLVQMAKRTGSTVVKAVTIPAWQFFRLIPWHAASNTEPKNDDEVARHFNQRPVVGICLKRYTMSEKGIPERQNTLIDIPDSLRLPHFMMLGADTSEQEPSGLSQEYKLVLQSVVCHRGESLHSGHYVSFARVAPKLLTDNRRHDSDPPPDYEEAQWAKFDDLAVDNRVTYVDDIKQALREEMPYLLFYQIVPMLDVTTASSDGSVTEPPSYDDLKTHTGAQISNPEAALDASGSISRSASGYFDPATTLVHGTGPSIRFSSELERHSRMSLDEDLYTTQSKTASRRGSMALSESMVVTPAITPDTALSPVVTPQDESTTSRLSKAAARFKAGTKSRPTSQAGEGRISQTMSRLGFRNYKDPPRDSSSVTLPDLDAAASSSADEQPVIMEEEETDVASSGEKGKEHHLYLPRKDWGKSKSRDKEESKKEKAKGKEKDASDVPDRECAVM